MRQGEAKGSGDGYRMKSAPTDDMMPTTIALPRDLGHTGFPRHGNFYAGFSTLWKNISGIFHAMENIFPQYGKTWGHPPAPAGAAMNDKSPSPRQPAWLFSENKGLHRTAHKLRHLHAFATINPVAAFHYCACAPSGEA